MRKNYLHLCLFQPEIPQNTGTIGRLAAATQCRLHIIRPTNFSLNDKNLKRAGLDYWPYLDIEIHNSIDTLLSQFKAEEIAFLSKKVDRSYDKMPVNIKLLIFGRETSGLPETLHNKYPDNFYTIPMFHEKVRSLNLANAVSIVCYHQLLKRLNL